MAKKAIVMGATSGIGMEVAKLLAAKGWQVGIAGRRIERLQALISLGGITCYQQIDVTSPDAPAQLLELIDKLGGMDLYFHSSGIGWQNNSLDIEKEMKTLETNGLGFTRMVDTAFNWFATHHHCNPKARIACIEGLLLLLQSPVEPSIQPWNTDDNLSYVLFLLRGFLQIP